MGSQNAERLLNSRAKAQKHQGRHGPGQRRRRQSRAFGGKERHQQVPVPGQRGQSLRRQGHGQGFINNRLRDGETFCPQLTRHIAARIPPVQMPQMLRALRPNQCNQILRIAPRRYRPKPGAHSRLPRLIADAKSPPREPRPRRRFHRILRGKDQGIRRAFGPGPIQKPDLLQRADQNQRPRMR